MEFHNIIFPAVDVILIPGLHRERVQYEVLEWRARKLFGALAEVDRRLHP